MSRLPAFCWICLGIALLAGSCATAPVAPEKGAIAVWDLDDLSPGDSGVPPMGEFLSAQIIEVLRKREDRAVVERQRLLLALEELRLGTSSLADEATRLSLGRISGARLMVFGGYQVFGGAVRIDLRLVEVETAKVLKAVQKTSSSADPQAMLEIAGEAARDLVR
jgi:TolB-like protein